MYSQIVYTVDYSLPDGGMGTGSILPNEFEVSSLILRQLENQNWNVQIGTDNNPLHSPERKSQPLERIVLERILKSITENKPRLKVQLIE